MEITLVTSRKFFNDLTHEYTIPEYDELNIKEFDVVSDNKIGQISDHNKNLHKKLFGTEIHRDGCILYRGRDNRTLKVSQFNGAPKKLIKLLIYFNTDKDDLNILALLLHNSFWSTKIMESEMVPILYSHCNADSSLIIRVPEIIVKGKPLPEIGNAPELESYLKFISGVKEHHGQWGTHVYYYLPLLLRANKELFIKETDKLNTYLTHPELLKRVPDICSISIARCEKILEYSNSMEDTVTDCSVPNETPVQEERVTITPSEGEIERSARKLVNILQERNSITKIIPILEYALQEAKLRK